LRWASEISPLCNRSIIFPQGGESACRLLESLFAGKPDGLYLLLCLTDDEEPLWFDDLEHAIDCAEPISESDVFVRVGLAKQKYGPRLRCPSEEVAAIVGIFANIDLRSDAHPRDTLPRTVEKALAILPAEMPPSVPFLKFIDEWRRWDGPPGPQPTPSSAFVLSA